MENYKKGLFTGWIDVFNFTAVQNIKGKGFKLSTIFISLVVAAIFAIIPIIDNSMQEDADTDEIVETYGGIVDEQGNYNFKTIKKIYLLNETDYSDENMKLLLNASEKKLNNIDEIVIIDKITEEIAKEADAVVINSKVSSYGINLYVLSTYNTTVDEEEADVLGIVLISDTGMAAYGCGKFDSQQMQYLGMPSHVVSASDSEETFGTMFAKMIVPMIVTLFMYMIILIHGQAISKVVVADKSSKLVEMLLTSVRPYAIITGKILGVSIVAIAQMLIWILSGIVGFFVGDAIATSMNPDYVNIILEVIRIIKDDSEGFGFSIVAVIFAIISLVVGFLLYAVIAGLSGAVVSKVEDLSSSSAIFQIPVIISFFAAYLVCMMNAIDGSAGIWIHVVRYCPLTSPFILPADILLGSMSLLESVIALASLVVGFFVLVIITGKIYKGKLFNKK